MSTTGASDAQGRTHGMVVYRRCWLAVVCLVGASGTTSAIALAPPGLIITVIFVGAVAGGVVAKEVTRAGGTRRSAGQASALPITLTLSVLGLMVLAGGAGAQLVGLLGVSAPATLRRIRRFVDSDLPAPPAALAEPTGPPLVAPLSAGGADADPGPSPDVSTLSDADLCLAWRRSFTALQRDHHPSRCADVVRVRGRYLDELERRDPQAFRAWLDHGARASSDPGRYMSTTRPLNETT